jgi:hypothetical protein
VDRLLQSKQAAVAYPAATPKLIFSSARSVSSQIQNCHTSPSIDSGNKRSFSGFSIDHIACLAANLQAKCCPGNICKGSILPILYA